jgi:hypothetical protein
MADGPSQKVVEQMQAWTNDLGSGSISEADRHAIVVSESARSFVLDGLDSADHDSLHAWAVLGRVLADAGASPTLAAHTVDALRDLAVGRGTGSQWCAGARAALIEAYVAAQRERAELRMAESWRFPRCVVRLDERTAAVAAFFPDDDADATVRWADEVAAGLARMGVRCVHAEGSTHARAALADALTSFGIDLTRART